MSKYFCNSKSSIIQNLIQAVKVMQAASSMISLDNVTKRFGSNEVLKGINLTVQDRHRVGLVGSNGSGKSTLLKILAGKDHYDGGTLSMTRGLRIGYHTQLDDLTSVSYTHLTLQTT